jgi:hypothetical protein
VGGGEVGRRGKFWGREGAEKSLGREQDVFLVHSQNSMNGLILNWWLLVHSSPASLVDRRKDQLGDSCGTVAFCSERKALRCRLLLLLQYETGDFAVARKWLRRLQLSQMDPEEAHIVIATAQNTV